MHHLIKKRPNDMLFYAVYESQHENGKPKQNSEYNTRDYGTKNK